jgi:hypothetical protein
LNVIVICNCAIYFLDSEGKWEVVNIPTPSPVLDGEEGEPENTAEAVEVKKPAVEAPVAE